MLPQGVTQFRPTFAAPLEAERDTWTSLRLELFNQLYEECCAVDKRRVFDNEQMAAMAAAHPVGQRFEIIPGLGPLTATALVAAVSDATHVKHGRQWAAW